MDICGEHGDEIAYSGRNCPACAQIEELNSDHKHEVEMIIEDFETQIEELESKIYDLENK